MIFDKFTLSLITEILGFGIWNIQRFMEDRKNAHAKVLKQDNLVRAIYAEIDFNSTDMEIFLTKSPSLPVLRKAMAERDDLIPHCLLYTSPSPRDLSTSRMPSSA